MTAKESDETAKPPVTTPSEASDKARQDGEAAPSAEIRKNRLSPYKAIDERKEISTFPLKAPVELLLVNALKDATYQYCGRLTVAQVVGCFHIALEEIREDQA